MSAVNRVPIRELIKRFDLFLLDNWGVLTRGKESIAGTAETIKEIQMQGKRVMLLSNTASEPPEDIQQTLKNRGIELGLDNIVTSGMVLTPYFAEHGLVNADIFNLGNTGGAEYIERAGGIVLDHKVVLATPSEVAAVVVTRQGLKSGLTEFMPRELIEAAVNILMYGPGVQGIIANPDKTVPREGGKVGVAGGALGALLEACSQREMVKLGKPYMPIYDLALSLVPNVPRDRIIMVDDSLEYGILGAHNAGIKSLVVMTGNTKTDDQIRVFPVQPDFVADAFRLDC